MKIAFVGKGGVGKTTIAAALILYLSKQGKKALAVDADPDPNLAGALGFPDADKITPISKMKNLIFERMEIDETNRTFYKLNPEIDDIPDKFSMAQGNIKLIVMGTVEKGGSGCACPESEFLKALLRKLVVSAEDWVVLDMEAGIEHLGRKTAQTVDAMITVVEPSMRSIETAQRIKPLAFDIGIKRIAAVGNKIKDKSDEEFIRKNLEGMDLLSTFDFSSGILRQDKSVKQNLLDDEKILKGAKALFEKLEEI